MKIAIIGLGFVGNALFAGLKNNVNVLRIDPKLGTKISELASFNPEIVFVCVPTPMNNQGEQDISILKNVIEEIKQIKSDALIVLKSTVLPNYIFNVSSSLKKFAFNPEFLREDFAEQDFINSRLIIFGCEKKHLPILKNFYSNHTNCINKDYVHTDAVSASFIKYTVNCFLATKVTFFNQIYEAFQKSGSKDSWKSFIEAISRDKRIGSSHMMVPGPDGRKGYGGACFPKDTNAFFKYSESINSPLSLIEKSIDINNQIRSVYENITDREKEQNINFNSKDL